MQQLQNGKLHVHFVGIISGSIRAGLFFELEAGDKSGFFISNDGFNFLLRLRDFAFAPVATAPIHLFAAALFPSPNVFFVDGICPANMLRSSPTPYNYFSCTTYRRLRQP